MNYFTASEKYAPNFARVKALRKRGGFSKHITSVPYQWIRNRARKDIVKKLEAFDNFPSLADSGNQDIIVSLTTIPSRIDGLHLVIKSILLQTDKPGKITLWLTEEEFPQGLDGLPESLKKLIPNGLEIHFAKHNYKPHNKYFWAFEKHPDKIIITIDDDQIYPIYSISHLLDLHKRFPNAVCANRAKCKVNPNDPELFPPETKLMEYNSKEYSEDMWLLATGVGGVLYPTGEYRKLACNPELIAKLAPIADDLWLKAIEIVAGVKTAVQGGSEIHEKVCVSNTQTVALYKINIIAGQNEVQWDQLDKHFSLIKILNK